jgi:hypothetical protein
MVSCVRPVALLTAVALAAIATSCRSANSPGGIDRTLASYVPPDTVVLAGFQLDQLRATSLYRSLPSSAVAAGQSLHDASYLLAASNGREVLFLARGNFREAPPGATLISGNLALAGSADSVRAALAQHQTGVAGAQRLLELAAGVAGGRQVWMVAQGGITLPLTGNSANLNRILHYTDYVTLAAQIDSRIQIDATGVCRSADAGRQLEESLRAILTLIAAAGGRQSEMAATLHSIEIRRDGLSVHATMASSSESAEKLIRELTR